MTDVMIKIEASKLKIEVEDDDCDACRERRTEQDKWVSVNERLPERGGEYLVWPGAFVDSHSAQFHALTKVWTQSGINGTVTQYVTHWRPLPIPPEEAK